MIEFVVLGQPMGKQRPKFSRRGNFVSTYTPEKTVNYEQTVRLEYERQCGAFMFESDVPLKLEVYAYFKIPESISKKKRSQMIEHELLPTKKCDCDNILKIIADAGNGVIYPDDKQIVRMMISKFYDEVPRVEIKIGEVKR